MLNINFWTDPSCDEDKVSDKHSHYKKKPRNVDNKQGTGRLAFPFSAHCSVDSFIVSACLLACLYA